ncbi:MAG: hypothetical protein FWE04_03220 [Oscillospiraceae bacterium]|nr:hypothetical protein [Oscillospiraceae bacterium]
MSRGNVKKVLKKATIDTKAKYSGTKYIVKSVFNLTKTETISQKVERLLLKS